MVKKKSSAIRFLDPTVESFETIVGPRTVFRGNIAAFESIRIDGKVIGNIESPPGSNITVALGRTAMVEGDINTYRALIAGKVKALFMPLSGRSFMMALTFMERSFTDKLGLSKAPS